MTLVYADTGYWAALLNRRDALHNVAKRLSLAISGDTIATSELVLTEVLNSFTVGAHSRSLASRAVADLRADPNTLVVPLAEISFENALALYQERQDKGWSLTDCSSFLIMRQLRISSALTEDRHFEQAGFRALLRE